MTEQPDPTRELDQSEIDRQLAEAEAPHQEDVVEGEPGWKGDSDSESDAD